MVENEDIKTIKVFLNGLVNFIAAVLGFNQIIEKYLNYSPVCLFNKFLIWIRVQNWNLDTTQILSLSISIPQISIRASYRKILLLWLEVEIIQNIRVERLAPKSRDSWRRVRRRGPKRIPSKYSAAAAENKGYFYVDREHRENSDFVSQLASKKRRTVYSVYALVILLSKRIAYGPNFFMGKLRSRGIRLLSFFICWIE